MKGPFGFVPTASGLSSSMRLFNSHLAEEIDNLLGSVDDTLVQLKIDAYSQSVNKSHLSLSELESYKSK